MKNNKLFLLVFTLLIGVFATSGLDAMFATAGTVGDVYDSMENYINTSEENEFSAYRKTNFKIRMAMLSLNGVDEGDSGGEDEDMCDTNEGRVGFINWAEKEIKTLNKLIISIKERLILIEEDEDYLGYFQKKATALKKSYEDRLEKINLAKIRVERKMREYEQAVRRTKGIRRGNTAENC